MKKTRVDKDAGFANQRDAPAATVRGHTRVVEPPLAISAGTQLVGTPPLLRSITSPWRRTSSETGSAPPKLERRDIACSGLLTGRPLSLSSTSPARSPSELALMLETSTPALPPK